MKVRSTMRTAATLARHTPSDHTPIRGTLIAAANAVVTIWHVYVLGRLQPDMTTTELTLFAAAINVIPICAMALLWTSWRRSAGLIFAAFFAVVLTIGIYEHFLRAGADNIFTMASGTWALPYRLSAVLLVMVDAAGCLFRHHAATGNRGGRTAMLRCSALASPAEGC